MRAVAAIDQGTTSTKAFLLILDENDPAGMRCRQVFGREHAQSFPRRGWVEHDAAELAANVAEAALAAGNAAREAGLELVGMGLDNQGETVVAWNAATGEPIHPAIVWQDARTESDLERLRRDGAEHVTLARAGLPLDPYFGASKLRWILDNVPEARALASKGLLRMGSSDAFFLDTLAGRFATDVATASRTSLMNLETLDWDQELLDLFGVPREVLPEILPCTAWYGTMSAGNGQRIPVTAALVDQQAALFGHGCFAPGAMKITFGTGAFALANAGSNAPKADRSTGVLPTVAWQLEDEFPTYAVDGGLYNAASAVNWLISVGLAKDVEELNGLEGPSAGEAGVFFVPALSGLACPHWDRRASALWLGMDLDTDRRTLQKAVLEGVALRAAELVEALEKHAGASLPDAPVGVDGGLTRNEYFCTYLADVLQRPLHAPATSEMTAVGCGLLACLGAGLYDEPGQLPLKALKGRIHHPRPERAQTMRRLRERFAQVVDKAKGWRID